MLLFITAAECDIKSAIWKILYSHKPIGLKPFKIDIKFYHIMWRISKYLFWLSSEICVLQNRKKWKQRKNIFLPDSVELSSRILVVPGS